MYLKATTPISPLSYRPFSPTASGSRSGSLGPAAGENGLYGCSSEPGRRMPSGPDRPDELLTGDMIGSLILCDLLLQQKNKLPKPDRISYATRLGI